MKRKIISLILALVMLTALAAPASAAESGPNVVETKQAVTVDGKAVDADAYNIDGYNYFKLRDIAYFLNGTSAQFSVGYDEATRTVSLATGNQYEGEAPVSAEAKEIQCAASNQTVAIDEVACTPAAFNINGYNYFKLRDLGQLLGFGVEYDEATNTAKLSSTYDRLSFGNAIVSTVHPHLDGKEISVTMYEDVYVAAPNRVCDQMISVYVPANATKTSPIIFLVNNSGWQADAYSGRTQVKSYGTEMQTNRMTGVTAEVTVGDYKSGTDTDNIGQALSEGYVIVSYGCRSRNNGMTGDEYLGHSPATMTDTKAAIRYLRYNKDILPAGDPEKIVVTGTSGGGALSAIISASGNSADYFASLYEIGAAGIKYENGKYTSTIGDDVFATIAYCPITDLGNADGAYEYTYSDTRATLFAEGNLSYKGVANETVMEASKELKAAYSEYVTSLGLKKADGTALTGDNLKGAIEELMKTEIEESIKEIGVEPMKADITSSTYNDSSWLTLNSDGSYTYDIDKHLYFVARNTELKVAPAFSNQGLKYEGQRNEDNLFGSVKDDYSPFEFWSWNNDATKNAVGQDDTGLTWDEYVKTDAGKALTAEIKMTNPIAYLIDAADGDSAPNWYVRYGMKDRDSSFALETVLYYAMLNDKSIDNMSFEFAWLKPHSGNYDVQEAYAWLKTIL